MRVLVFANGKCDFPPNLQDVVDASDVIIAADGGANHCNEHNIQPDILLGDFDSISPGILDAFQQSGVEIHRHPSRKNATDLELALDLAMARGAKSVSMFGVLGGRWDMSIANIMLAAGERYRHLAISLISNDCSMRILHPGQEHILEDKRGQTVSLLPLRGDVHGVTLTGFEYPLHEHSILFGSSLGVSNVLLAERAVIRHREGILLCVSQLEL